MICWKTSHSMGKITKIPTSISMKLTTLRTTLTFPMSYEKWCCCGCFWLLLEGRQRIGPMHFQLDPSHLGDNFVKNSSNNSKHHPKFPNWRKTLPTSNNKEDSHYMKHGGCIRGLLRNCPQHDLNVLQEVSIFYDGVNVTTRQPFPSQGPLTKKAPSTIK